MEPRTVPELLRARAEGSPDRTAFVFLHDGEDDEARLTYGQLQQHAVRVASALRGHAEPGERALLLFVPGLDFIQTFFGCLMAGVVPVPVVPPLRSHTLADLVPLLQRSGARLALTSSFSQELFETAARQTPGFEAVQWLASDTFPEPAWDSLPDMPELSPDTLAFLQFTSGSTSSPKGVEVTHGCLLANQYVIQRAMGSTHTDVGLSWLPMYHDMGLIGHVIQPVHLGVPQVLFSPMLFLQRPARWLEAVTRYRATISGAPNFAYELCLRKVTESERAKLDLSSWRVAYSGAEPVRAATLDRFSEVFADCGFRRTSFLPTYGLAEATLMVSGGPSGRPPRILHVQTEELLEHRVVPCPVEAPAARPLVAVGEIEGAEVRILRPESGEPCGNMEVGEICVRGPSVARGYFGDPEATEKTFGSGDGRSLHTGDLGFVYEGQLFVTGRIKDVIILRGRNYYPSDLEPSVERAHAAVRPGCVVAFSVDRGPGEQLVVVAELERRYLASAAPMPGERRDAGQEPWTTVDGPVSMEEVADAIRRRVGTEHGLAVADVVLVRAGALPKTSSGKPRRFLCRNLYLKETLERLR